MCPVLGLNNRSINKNNKKEPNIRYGNTTMLNYIFIYLTSIFHLEDNYSKVTTHHPDIPSGVGDKFSNKNMTHEHKRRKNEK